jgi:hypothetical protein
MDGDGSSTKDAYDLEVSKVDNLASTWVDRADMKRLGRTQEIKRSFRQLSMLSFAVIVQATWEFVLWCVVLMRVRMHELTHVQLHHAWPAVGGTGRPGVELRVDIRWISADHSQSR